MPITLEKLFSATNETSFEYEGETVNVTWAPSRYTGEMDDLAAKIDQETEENAAALTELLDDDDKRGAMNLIATIRHTSRLTTRRFLAALLVTWDVLDGKDPLPTDEATLAKLPPEFLDAVFRAITRDNQEDPPKPDPSPATSEPKGSPAPSPRGSGSSRARTTSASHRGT
jgi:hypothetical protein